MYICDDDADGSIAPHIFTVIGASILSVHDLLADVNRGLGACERLSNSVSEANSEKFLLPLLALPH